CNISDHRFGQGGMFGYKELLPSTLCACSAYDYFLLIDLRWALAKDLVETHFMCLRWSQTHFVEDVDELLDVFLNSTAEVDILNIHHFRATFFWGFMDDYSVNDQKFMPVRMTASCSMITVNKLECAGAAVQSGLHLIQIERRTSRTFLGRKTLNEDRSLPA
ncbi:hypothetical protein ACJX0J_031596, partial [Zea mays]